MRENEITPSTTTFPSVARLALASVVRDEMWRCEFTCRSLAEATGMSSATVNRCMMGKREVTEYELGALGAAFGWNGDTRDRMRQLWVTSATGAGEVAHRDEILSHLHRVMVESVVVAPWVLPTGLRTGGYDAVITGRPDSSEPRRRTPFGQHTTVFLTHHAVTTPPALPADQWAAQVAHLVGLAESEQVHLRFLPGQVNGVHGLEPFEVVRLRNDIRYVRLDHHGITTLLDNPDDVATYHQVLDNLDTVAEPATAWRAWLRKI